MDIIQSLFFALLIQGNNYQVAKNINMHPPAEEHNIMLGEQVQYKLYFGLIPVGKAQIYIFKDYYRINHRECYRIDIQARTVGAVDWVAKVDDKWGAYIDRVSLLPHMAYRDLKEGGFKKKEIVRYDHKTQTAEVLVLNNKTGEFHEPKFFHMPMYIRDLVSGMMLLRSVPFDTVRMGDTLRTDAFFEETLYDFKVVYDGTEEIKTKLGWIKAHRLLPVMPENPVFDGEDSIVAWISADENQVPLKMEAEMFVGSASLEVIEAEGLAAPLGKKAERQAQREDSGSNP